MLLLATVVHHTPNLHPYDYLVWLMRGVSALFLASGAVRFERFVVEL